MPAPSADEVIDVVKPDRAAGPQTPTTGRADAAHHARDRAVVIVGKDRQYWTIFDDDGEPVGRSYEMPPRATPAELRWFWSVVVCRPRSAFCALDLGTDLGAKKR
jgi:hypothetical protein